MIQFSPEGKARGTGYVIDVGAGQCLEWVFPTLETAMNYANFMIDENAPVVRKVQITYSIEKA